MSGESRLRFDLRDRRGIDKSEVRHKFVLQHTGPFDDFLIRYKLAVMDARAAGDEELEKLYAGLIDFVADERNLMTALVHLLLHGGPSAGPDGERLFDRDRISRWSLVRELRDQLREGNYLPGPLKYIKIQKHPGSSATRTITVASVRDRIVSRGVMQILAPLLEPAIAESCFSWERRGRLAALAHAVNQVRAHNRTVWIIEDLQDAFDQVPRSRLNQILRQTAPNEAFCRLVDDLAAQPTRRGILQGSSLSSALLDLYLSRVLHRPWRLAEGLPPLATYVDDLHVACTPEEDPVSVYRELERYIHSAGMKPKLGFESAIYDLRRRSVTWLGYLLRLTDGELEIRSKLFAPTSREQMQQKHERLVDKFARLHERPDGWQYPNAVIHGMVADLGPTLPFEDHQRIYHTISTCAAEAGFSEIWTFDEMMEHWQAAHARWLKRLGAATKPEGNASEAAG